MSELNFRRLPGKWVHSFEEDTDEDMVYRPGEFSFPRARGRASMDLKENGEIVDFLIGRNDVPGPATGQWQLAGEKIIINYHDDDNSRTYAIKEITDDKLVLKKR
jgi:hypothetical protein